MFKRLQERFDNEPVMVIEALRAIIVCAVGFGLTMTNEQQALLMVAIGAVIALLTRGKVTPTSGTAPSVDVRKYGAVLLVVALGAGAASACGGNIAPQLVATEDGVHDALAAAQDGIEKVCAPRLTPTACREVNAALVPALRAGAAFNRAVRDQQLGAVGTLVEAIGALVAKVQALSPGELRDAIVNDLRRAIAAAFSVGGQTHAG